MLPGPPTTGGAERTQPGAEQRRDLHTRTPFQSTSTPNKSPPRKPITPAQLAPRSLTSTVGKPNPYKNLFKNLKDESRGPGPYQRPQKFEEEIVHKKLPTAHTGSLLWPDCTFSPIQHPKRYPAPCQRRDLHIQTPFPRRRPHRTSKRDEAGTGTSASSTGPRGEPVSSSPRKLHRQARGESM